jgi:rubrerythrin
MSLLIEHFTGGYGMSQDELRESLLEMIKTLDKAISMEKHARDFYAEAARKTDSEQGKKMFNWLAQFESGHKARLESKRNDFASHSALAGTELPGLGEYGVSETGGPIKMPEDATDLQILKIAIENEMKAYSYYQRKLTHARDESVKAILKKLAGDEEKHMQILRDQAGHIEVNRMWTEMEELDRQIQKFSAD